MTQTATVQLDVDTLLAPAAGGTPSGPDLRYLPVYDELKTARKTAEAEPQELIPWKKLADLSAKALAQSKDLQLAIWLMEPLARVEGFRGVSAGLVILRRLLVEFWESLYPAIDPDDSEPLGFRKALLNWVDEKLPAVIRTIPLTAPPASFGLLHYDVTLKTGDEKKALLEEGWPSSERFEEALNISSLTHLESVLEQVIACEAERAALQSVVDQRFNADGRGGDPVTFSSLKETFETCQWLVERPAKRKRQEQMPAAPPEGDAATAAAAAAHMPGDRNGDQIWAQALDLTRGSKVDGLRLMEAQLAAAVAGRERFLRQLQLGELCLEAGVHTLAFPIFDDLAKTIDARQLEEWEDRTLIVRVWKGLIRCCGLLEGHVPAAGPRGKEILERLARVDAAQPTT